MEEKKIIGMPFKCVLGLTWLLFPFGIVALAVDHEKMTKEEKQHIVQAFVVLGFFTIIGIILNIISSIVWAIASNAGGNADFMNYIGLAISLAMTIILLIFMIEAFLGKFIKVGPAWSLAGAFLGSDKKEEAKAEEVKTEEAKTEEEKTE